MLIRKWLGLGVGIAVATAACAPTSGEESVRGAAPLSDAEKKVDTRYTQGSGLAVGLVTGRIYDDLDRNAGARMSDLEALGVRIIRVEIESDDYAKYRRIVQAANRYGIDVLALISGRAAGNPLAGDASWFNDTYVPSYVATVERILAAIPELRFIEIFNEPDVYDFRPLAGENARRYALVATRVYEELHAKNADRPKIAAFDFSRHDDGTLRKNVFDDVSILNHRKGYRPQRGLPDGLPADIVSIHGYGNDQAAAPDQTGYTYDGQTFEGGVRQFLDSRFAESVNGNDRVVNQTPVWYTEVGWGASRFGEQKQAQLVEYAFATLRKFREVTAAFWYDYRDDEGGGGETNGLRSGNPKDVDNPGCGRTRDYDKHASWDAFQRAAGGSLRPTFSDTPFSHDLHDAVEALYAHGITTGYDSDHFGPEDHVTKAQIDVFMARARGESPAPPAGNSPDATRLDMAHSLAPYVTPLSDYKGYFKDVGPSDDSVHVIEALREAGIANGFDAGGGQREFRPSSSLTRAEMSAFICRTMKIR